jgi:hypothetical protein
MFDKLITYIVWWYKTVYQVLSVATRSDTGSHNRLDLIQSLVPPHYACNGYLFPLHKGVMKICSPEKSHISRGQRPREIWLFRGWTNLHISLMQGKWMFYSTRPTFWWILPNEIFRPSLFTKLLFRNISGVIFTNMEYRYMIKVLNLENFE